MPSAGVVRKVGWRADFQPGQNEAKRPADGKPAIRRAGKTGHEMSTVLDPRWELKGADDTGTPRFREERPNELH